VNGRFEHCSFSSVYGPLNPAGEIVWNHTRVIMNRFIAKASFAALLALASVPATASVAAAAGPERGSIVDVQYHHGRACSPVRAVEKARREGLRNVRVTDITPRRVVVSGRGYRGGWERMYFANVRGCPQIRR
jgi:S-adenosylmethionine:tRNA-ribosyltransferase-isomerase (queuine synthetase)